MAYCTRNDLLLGNIARPADAVLDVYVQNGSDTIDTKLGFRFTTPIVINTGIPGSNASVTLLKQLNVYLATGMFIVATSASAEDIQLNAYGRYLLTQAELALDAIASSPERDWRRGAEMTTPFSMIIIVDDRSAERVLRNLEAALSDSSIEGFLLRNTADYIHRRTRDRFTGEGDDVTGAWQPLQPATEAIRVSRGYPGPHPINVRTGDMESFLAADPGAITGQTTWTFPAPGAATGELAEKIKTAQQGKASPSTVIGMNNVDEAFITTDLEAFLVRGLMVP
jgi:hypothetical protein